MLALISNTLQILTARIREVGLKANESALTRLNELAEMRPADAEVVQRLRVEYEDRIRQLRASESDSNETPQHLFSLEYEQFSYELLQVERRIILQLRNEGIINDEVLRRIQRDIDLAEARLGHPHSRDLKTR